MKENGEPRSRLLLMKYDVLRAVKEQLAAEEEIILPAMLRLRREADKALTLKPLSVVYKKNIPPSGDKHDYISLGRYWWPNPATPDGLPYIRRDGEVNPETEQQEKYDRKTLGLMVQAVATLALAYFFFEREAYARKASTLLRTWFLDPETRMNPNLNYAQLIPGRVTGRGTGLIDTRGFVLAIDAAQLLLGTDEWSLWEHRALQNWFKAYLDWLLNSKHGRDEAAAANNHGTMYDFQVAAYALFTGETALARQTIVASRERRIAVQIEPDGRQPLELVRTKALDYSVMNLTGLLNLAQLGQAVGVNLCQYRTEDGRSIEVALKWLIPYLLEPEKWPYQQISAFEPKSAYYLLWIAAHAFHNQLYARYNQELARKNNEEQLLSFLYPPIV